MRVLIWTCRVVLLIVVGAFVATVYYTTHSLFTDVTGMDAAMPTLDLVTVLGTGLLGVVWALARRYWNTLILLASLGLVRGLLGDELLTRFQGVWLLVSIGVAGFAFVVSITARALINERALRAAKAATAHATATAETSMQIAAAAMAKPRSAAVEKTETGADDAAKESASAGESETT